MNVVLIGYRGVGKTTVALRLAARLGWEWADSDDQVETLAGKSIAAIFAESGEEVFRDLESRAVADLGQRQDVVLAVGGGAVLRPQNAAVLRRSGRLVWLVASPETILARLEQDAHTGTRRPNLLSGGESEVRELLERRAGVYRASADLEVATDDKSPAEVADEILRRLPDLTERAKHA